jgi:glycosyltransferase involved in cell wall biosynthesis
VAEHPFAVKAFGVDTRAMRDQSRPHRSLDWLMVGRLAEFKRPERLMTKQGRRLAIGDLSSADPALVARLKSDGIEVRDFVPYTQLADFYNDAAAVLVPCTLQGGGERAVQEARACGCHVQIADDNPKLASLLAEPVADHLEYSHHLSTAIEEVVAGRRIDEATKVEGQRRARWDLWSDKVRRTPSTVRTRTASLVRHLPSRRR